MRDKIFAGFTLLELIVVVVIIGILASIALPNFAGMRERAMGREAQANLRLIAAAERIFMLENDNFYGPTGDVGDINTNLKLSLSEDNWDYAITNAGGGSFTATASRPGCTYTVTDASDPVAGGGCL